MLVRVVAFFATLPLRVRIIWRNFQCWRFSKSARNREDCIYELSKHIINSFISTDKNINYVEYHFQSSLGYPTEENGERFSEICWEAPVCFTIFFDGKPLVGMGLELQGSAVCIWQLQGVCGVNVPKTIHKWPALFVEGAKKFVLETEGMHSVRVYAADQRISYKFPEGDLSEEDMRRHQRNLRRRYDGTARQKGFKKVSEKYWEWKK